MLFFCGRPCDMEQVTRQYERQCSVNDKNTSPKNAKHTHTHTII